MIVKTSLVWDEIFPSLCLKGEGAYAFLHGQTTADIFAQKKEGHIFKSCWLSTNGTLKALLEIRLSDNMAEIIIISGDINFIKEGFESVIFPADKVTLEVSKSVRRIQKINDYLSWKDSTSIWLNDNDFPFEKIENHSKATKRELELWKIKQGIPSFDREMNGETNPYELGVGDLIKLDKGCYLGQESMARISRAKYLKNQLRYWEGYGEFNNFVVGQKLFNTNQDEGLKKNVGVITSSVKINDNYFNGLALIKTNYLDHESLFSCSSDAVIIKKPISFSYI